MRACVRACVCVILCTVYVSFHLDTLTCVTYNIDHPRACLKYLVRKDKLSVCFPHLPGFLLFLLYANPSVALQMSQMYTMNLVRQFGKIVERKYSFPYADLGVRGWFIIYITDSAAH